VDTHDIAVIELGQRLGLALQTLTRGQLLVASRLEQLDCYLSVQFGIVGRVDNAHGPGAELVEDQVTTDPRALTHDRRCWRVRRAWRSLRQLIGRRQSLIAVENLPTLGHCVILPRRADLPFGKSR